MKLALVVAISLAVPAFSAASAQSNPIEVRQNLMKANGRDAKAGGEMLKGAVPFDAAKAATIFAEMNDVAKKFGDNFPASSKTGSDTTAAPAIWDKPAEFKAALVKFQKDTASAMAAKPATVEAFGQQFGIVAANCKSCHEQFRIKK